ncbi:UDP-glucosyltransferase, putative [Ricinus communis]|uniref:anthocyanidin 3-O-glucosyltransferase n=2 Tax=Ricinus communis TaxID=3988 RepID=B9RX84_RICCO|nr:UDP-glucosyltransferase, putative [Ricinus communis]
MTEMGQINCLITDAFLLFGGAIAEDLNVPWIPVWIPVPHSLSAHIYSDMIRKHYNINNLSSDNDSRDPENILEKIPGLGELRIADLPDEVLLNETQESLLCYMLSQVGNVLPQASALVMNFYKELYSTPLLDDLKTKFPSLLNVGFLTLSIPPCPLPLSNADATGCLSWLDSQKPTSVAYISFGTVVNIPSSEIVELAEALEETKLPFLWSLRDNLISKLPQGFLDRTKLDGKVVPWAPQNQVLAHNSINVYITHCGANSVYESMANGVPMICRPVFADNRINARIVEDIWGIGVRIDDGVFTKKGVIKSLELVLENEEGRRIRRKVHALQQLVFKAAKANGHAAQDFKTLVEKCSLK